MGSTWKQVGREAIRLFSFLARQIKQQMFLLQWHFDTHHNCTSKELAPVVGKVDYAVHCINRSPVDKCQWNKPLYPLDGDLSSWQRCPPFEQPRPVFLSIPKCIYVESAISAYDGRGFQNVAVGHINGVPQEKMRSHGVLCARINEVWAWFDVWTFRRDKKKTVIVLVRRA